MSYKKQNFIDGIVLTARQLNYMEDGIEKNSNDIEKATDFIITITSEQSNITSNKRFEEILNAINNGRDCIVNYYGTRYNIISYSNSAVIFGNTIVNKTNITINKLTISNIDKVSVTQEIVSLSQGGSIGNISTFDLTVMGLPHVPMDGTEVNVNVDTTEMINALKNGLIKLKLKLEIFANATTDVEGISSVAYLSFYDSYVCRLLTNKNNSYEIRIIVSNTGITAYLVLLDKSETTEIDEDELKEMLEEVLA